MLAASAAPSGLPKAAGPALVAAPTAGTSPAAPSHAVGARFLHFTADNFLHFTSENGLSQNTIRAILQDRTGFLWFATEEGLNRFDGYTFLVFKNQPGHSDSLPQDLVTMLYQDRAGQLWVGAVGNVSTFDPRTETFKTRLTVQREVMAMLEDRSGALWVATAGDGLYRLDPGAAAPVRYQHDAKDPNSLASDSVFALAEDSAGRLWVGTFGGGLDLLDRDKGAFAHHRHQANDPTSLAHDEIWSLAEDGSGRLWAGTNGGGLSILDLASGKFQNHREGSRSTHRLSAEVVTVVYKDRAGTMWVGTERAGLHRYIVEDDSFVVYQHDDDHPDSLGQNAVRAIYEDTQGNLWVSTYSEGLSLMRRNEHSFEYYGRDARGAGLVSGQVIGLTQDRDGAIWVGTTEGGLHRFDHDRRGFVPYRVSHSAILSISQDRRGRLWAATYGEGLYRFEPERGASQRQRLLPEDQERQRDNQIWSIYEDADGLLWLATDDGILRFNPDTGAVSHYRHDDNVATSLVHDQVRGFTPDGEGGLWVATLGGLDHWTNGEFRHYRHTAGNQRSLSHDWVLSVYRDGHGVVWAGTDGGGLNRLDPQSGDFTAYRDVDGLPSNAIYAILEDNEHRLWLSTNKGLCRFTPASGQAEIYDLSNGLQSLQFNLGSAVKTHTGAMLFGSWKGLYYFEPERIKPNPFAPPIIFTGLRVFGEPKRLGTAIHLVDEIRLSHEENIFSLEFAALDYTFPRRNRYKYKLEGFNDRWIDLGNKREVTFTNLNPGEYVFRVMGSNSDGVWGELGGRRRIIIPPPFWATWWWQLSCAVVILGGLWSAHRLRMRRLEERERELEIRVEDALSRVKILKGLLPICATCKKVRDDKGYWNQIESYIRDRSEADFSHGICPDCVAQYYPEFQGVTAKKPQ